MSEHIQRLPINLASDSPSASLLGILGHAHRLYAANRKGRFAPIRKGRRRLNSSSSVTGVTCGSQWRQTSKATQARSNILIWGKTPSVVVLCERGGSVQYPPGRMPRRIFYWWKHSNGYRARERSMAGAMLPFMYNNFGVSLRPINSGLTLCHAGIDAEILGRLLPSLSPP